MRLIRFGQPGAERPGLLIGSSRKDFSSQFRDWDTTFFQKDGLTDLKRIVAGRSPTDFRDVPSTERWGPPIARPGKIVCIGLNYSDHARESGQPIPTEPIVFLKAPNTVVGPYDPILIPRGSEKTDWEVELGVVIGATARYLNSPADALRCVAGYCVNHDVSERHFQLERGGQWTKGKSCDTFNPIGPWLSTPDELPRVDQLSMHLKVNGTARQVGNTSTMIFDVPTLIHYLSQFMTLEPGDLISTGTPPGVGLGMKPPQYLKEGDVIELSIDGLGVQRQVCVRAEVPS